MGADPSSIGAVMSRDGWSLPISLGKDAHSDETSYGRHRYGRRGSAEGWAPGLMEGGAAWGIGVSQAARLYFNVLRSDVCLRA
jgi:hypothetical protein